MPRVVMRRGGSLVEVLVAMALAGLASSAVGALLLRQHRAFGALTGIIGARTQLREARDILPVDLRALAPTEGDVLALADSAIELRATIASSVVCAIDSVRGALELPPATLASGQTLTSIGTTPSRADVAYVYDDGVLPSSDDDRWLALPVDTLTNLASPCAGSPLLDPVRDAGKRGYRLTLHVGAPRSSTLRPGAPVRITRRVRYRLYRASTGDWQLGWADWGGGAFNTVQPVSGPYLPYSRLGASGLTLQYLDEDLQPVTRVADAARLARIDVILRARAPSAFLGAAQRIDSLAVVVAPRGGRP